MSNRVDELVGDDIEEAEGKNSQVSFCVERGEGE